MILTGILLIAVALTMWAEHYYPHWRTQLDEEPGHPKRLQGNYIAGILGIFVWFTVDLLISGFYWETIVKLWLYIAVAGLTVFGMYWHDERVNDKQKLRDQEEQLELRKRQDVPEKRT